MKNKLMILMVLFAISPLFGEIVYVDDFSADSTGTYSWFASHSPDAIPGRSAYAKYHHDTRNYSFSTSVADSNVVIVGDDWFLGRIYAYKHITFGQPLKALTLSMKGKTFQGIYNNNVYWGAALYNPDFTVEQDFQITNLGDVNEIFVNSICSFITS